MDLLFDLHLLDLCLRQIIINYLTARQIIAQIAVKPFLSTYDELIRLEVKHLAIASASLWSRGLRGGTPGPEVSLATL